MLQLLLDHLVAPQARFANWQWRPGMGSHLLARNRWLVVTGAIIIQLALGALYAWSVFTARLTDPAGAYAFSASETAWVFSTGLATFAIVMVLAGRILPSSGPRPLAIAGGLLLGAGFVAGGLFGETFWMQLLCIGLVAGAGIGLAYVVPIAVCVKWFPDKKGLITGLAVAGFGFGATIWVKLAGSWFGGLLNTSSVFGLPGVQSVFVIYGIVFFLLVFFGSAVMVNPPEGYQPAGWTPPWTPRLAPSALAVGSLPAVIDFHADIHKTTPFQFGWRRPWMETLFLMEHRNRRRIASEERRRPMHDKLCQYLY